MTSSSACVPHRIAVHALNSGNGTVFSRFARYGFLVVIFLLNACGATGDLQPVISFKPTLLPVKFTATQSGFAVTGDSTIVTALGSFSIGAKFDLPAKDGDVIRVVIRDRKRGGIGLDDVYDVKTGDGKFEAVTNGKTVTQITGEREVIIDVTDARIDSIEFRKFSLATLGGNKQNPSRWSKHWGALPFGYHPWSLARWAYNDSTMGKWYGAGYMIFLARLIIVIFLGIIDLLLVAVFFLAGIFYLFGKTARNVFYGLLVILVLWGFIAGYRRANYY